MAPNRYKILIIDDDPGFRELLSGILNQMDKSFKVRCGGSYREAKEEIEKELPDLILLDLSLPDKDGFYFLEEFRNNGHRDIPVLLVSASDNKQDKLKSLELGAVDFINKPIAIEDIKARIAVQLRLKKIVDDQKWAVQKTNEGIKILYKELEKKNKKLEQLDQLKDEFVNNVSHELRTPLTVIKESVGIVHDGSAGEINAEQKEFLTNAKRNIDRLARLIDDVLDFQKLDSKQIEIGMMENNINLLVREIRENFVPLTKNKGLKISLDLEASLPLIYFDRDKITQVLTNFMSNAVKQTDKGNITLKTRRVENTVRVSVEDQGMGVQEQDLPRLFQVFSQLTTGNKQTPGSTGLGLAISKKIIEIYHKGKIGVESVQGKGSTFYFLLPINERRKSK